MALDKLTKLTSNSGISTVIDYTMSDLVVDSINIAGGGTTLGKDFETRNLKVTGVSTFVGNVQMDGNLTVNGTTTTLDTNLIGVDRVEVVASDNNYAGIAVTQSGTGDIISAYDGSTQVFAVNDGNKVGIADSIYHIGDDNTAFGFPAADTFKIDTAGVERLRITSAGAIQCKGETDVQNSIFRVTDGTPRIIMSVPSGGLDTRLYNDGSGNFIIGHGTNSDTPPEKFRITSGGIVQLPAGANQRIGIEDRHNSTGVGHSLTISPGGGYGSGKTSGDLLLSRGRGLGGAAGGAIKFGYNVGDNTAGLDKVQMILDVNGKVGIGTDTPDQTLEIHTLSGTNFFKASTKANSTIGLEIEKTGATTQSWRIADGQTANGTLEFYDVTDSKTRIAIDGNGKITTGGGTPSFNNSGGATFGSFFEVNGAHTIDNFGVLGITGRTNTNNAKVARLQFLNTENSNTSSTGNANSRSLASIDVYADTSDSNAGDDCGGRIVFNTKAEAGGNNEILFITADKTVGINIIPTAGDLATGTTLGNPNLMVDCDHSGNGTYHSARFRAGSDNDWNAAVVTINHSNDRGLAIYGGRSTGNRSWAAFKSIDNVGRVSNAIEIRGGNGQGVQDLRFYTGESTSTTEALLIDSSGRLIVGDTSNRLVWGINPALQVTGTEWDDTCIALQNFGNNTRRPTLLFTKGKSGTVGNYGTSPALGDGLGIIGWSAHDTTDAENLACWIQGVTEQVATANNQYGAIAFNTVNGGTTGGERLRIQSNGNVGIARTINSYQLDTSNTPSYTGTGAEYNLSINREAHNTTTASRLGFNKTLNVDNQYAVSTFRAENINRNGTQAYFDIAKFVAWDINAKVTIQAGGTFTGDQVEIRVISSYNSALGNSRSGPYLEVKSTQAHSARRFTKVKLGTDNNNRHPILQVYLDGNATHNALGTITVTVHDYGSNYGGNHDRGEAKFATATTLNETWKELKIYDGTNDSGTLISDPQGIVLDSVISTGPKTITGGTNLAIQNFKVKGVWSGSPSIGKEIELISGYDSEVKMVSIGYNLTNTTLGSTYGGDLVFHTQPVYGSPTTPIPESMRITSSGYVTKPKTPSFMGRGYNGNSGGRWKFDEVATSTGPHNTGSHFDNSTGIFICPCAGNYFIAGSFGYVAAFNYISIGYSFNGTTKLTYWSDGRTGRGDKHVTGAFSAVLKCAKGDELAIVSSTSYSFPDTNSQYAAASIYLLG